MRFPEWFIALLVHASVVIAAVGAVVLVVLFVRDLRRGRLW